MDYCENILCCGNTKDAEQSILSRDNSTQTYGPIAHINDNHISQSYSHNKKGSSTDIYKYSYEHRCTEYKRPTKKEQSFLSRLFSSKKN